MAKMNGKMVALCAAAIGIIYTSGYAVTEPSQQSVQNPPTAAASAQKMIKGDDFKSPAYALQNKHTNITAANEGKYRDGIYYGQGSNRIGTVEVAVTINQGKIKSCKITSCTTHYSQSLIDPVLVNEVVERQGSNVDVVSGATKSSQDFRRAVQQALTQAL